MSKFFSLLCALAFASSACTAGELSATEQRWLRGVWPVVSYAKQAQLPLDVVVQPQDAPEAAPLSLGFVQGRCKLVLSMRGNPEAQATLDRIDPGLLDATLELMAAHELGHCRRYLDGAWYGVPAGFVAATPTGLSPELRAAWLDMKSARREEAYGDLVGLAWTQQRRPQQYAQLYRWLLSERSRDQVPGSPHDTLAWVRLAADPAALDAAALFSGPAALWTAGLKALD